MVGFQKWEEVLNSALESDEKFRETLKRVLKEFHLDMKEFSKLSGVSESSLYKIISGHRPNPRLSTLRDILRTLKSLESSQGGEPFIALIASRSSLDALTTSHVSAGNLKIKIKGYGASSIEDAIVAALNAEQEGAKAIVCGPVVATILQKIVRIPISSCPVSLCNQPLLEAAKNAARKIVEETQPSKKKG
ncbi:MAG: helix-turn-helix domain-containing protein [Candidatus Hadarchaeales archaeon]